MELNFFLLNHFLKEKPVKLAKSFAIVLILILLAGTAWAEGESSLVIGKNLKVGMSVNEAIKLLGIPGKIDVNRGTEPTNDSISIRYDNHGLIIHAMSGKGTIEHIELMTSFKGSFEAGIKIGSKFPDMIGKYGMPETLTAEIARYPNRGWYFTMANERLVSAKIFSRNSKILALKMIDK
jgi:hypothetical protein